MGIHFVRGDYKGNFLRKIKKVQDCWIWTGSMKNSYGQYYTGLAHRAAWKIFKGPIPDGLFVLHKCNVRLCVNPDHLYLGTQKQNLEQAVHSGRIAHGARQGLSKLDDEKVKEILRLRKEGVTQTALAEQFGVCQATVYELLSGQTWRHIPRS